MLKHGGTHMESMKSLRAQEIMQKRKQSGDRFRIRNATQSSGIARNLKVYVNSLKQTKL